MLVTTSPQNVIEGASTINQSLIVVFLLSSGMLLLSLLALRMLARNGNQWEPVGSWTPIKDPGLLCLFVIGGKTSAKKGELYDVINFASEIEKYWVFQFNLQITILKKFLFFKCEDLSALPIGEKGVDIDECLVHNLATWTHHLLTKVQQMKLMRSIFRC